MNLINNLYSFSELDEPLYNYIQEKVAKLKTIVEGIWL